MQKFLIVVDMQTDFVCGALGTEEAVKIVPDVAARVEKAISREEKIIFTRDTHQRDYMETQEGHRLPVPHCIQNSEGWQIIDELQKYTVDNEIVNKPTFGSVKLAEILREADQKEKIEQITLVGLCTDICVISNALLIKAYLPEVKLVVEASCCAGVSPAGHENALNAMRSCQIEIV